MIQLHLLGAPRLHSGDSVIAGPPAQRHRIALLALLVDAWPQPLPRDRALVLLWPEKDTASARRLLNLAVHVLRSALGDSLVQSVGTALAFNPANVECDLHALRLAMRADDADAIVARWSGTLLEGFSLDESVEFGYWLDERRRDLEQQYLQALRRVAERQEREGDVHGRVATCRKLVAADPYVATHALALMQALERAGERAAAIRHASEYAARLRADLELTPDAAVLLYADRLRRAPAPTSAAPASEASALSVAVLPFVERGERLDDYFAEGIAEDVIAHLTRIRAITVISRVTAAEFRERRHAPSDIGAALGVRTILEGSVRRQGERVRIVASLIEASTGRQLWAEQYDRALTDIFGIQSDVALHIADALHATLTRDERARVNRPPTDDFVAYQLLLQGRQWHIRYTAEGFANAVERFERALARDPHFALAAANLAIVLTEATENGMMSAAVALPRAASAVALALRADHELAEAHAADGYLRMMSDFDWPGAEAAFRRAIDLGPGAADAFDYFGRLLYGLGRWDESIDMVLRAQALDPLAHRNDLASALLRAGRYAEARARAEQALELEPEYDRARATLGWALLLAGEREAGVREMEHALAIAPNSTLWMAQLAQARAMMGDERSARETLAQLAARAATGYVSPYHLAYIHTGLGEADRATDLLEQAVKQRAGPAYAIKGSFLFAPLRTHPRFRALLASMHLDV
jgi:serine/threonine-protein kinase